MNWDNWEKKHQAEIKLYLQQVAAVYRSAVKEAAAIGATITQFAPSRPFSFSDYPHTKARIDKLASSLAGHIDTVVLNGIDAQWTLANNKNSVLCDRVFGDQKNKLTETQQRKYYTTNAPAREAFKARATNGLGLSDRVWKYTNQFKTEIELGLDLGLRDGLSAAEMSRDLKQYLQQPDKLFRRVRDEHGALRLSEAAKAYNSGRGVYRSSYKNALRLTSTETNIAYRTADFERWQGFDFVIGIEVKKSNNHPVHDMCDMLAGRYPKGFKFTGWHPNCRCYAVPILQEVDDFLEDKPATGQIENTPSNYNDWVGQNKDRFTAERNTPYFIRDNKGYTQSAIKTLDAQQKIMLCGYSLSGGTLADLSKSLKTGELAGFDLVKYDADLSSIFSQNGIGIKQRTLEFQPEGVSVILNGVFGFGEMNLIRTFTVANGKRVVHHDIFKLPNELQGRGIAAQMLRASYEHYKAAGIEAITIVANIRVGGYAWAKYGFSAEVAEVKEIVLNKLKAQEITQHEATNAYAVIGKNSRRGRIQMKLLAEEDYGKRLLMDSFWRGELDLTDASQMAIPSKQIYAK